MSKSDPFKGHNVPAMTRRLLRWYDLATPEQIASGTSWYMTARTFASDTAQRSGHTLEQVAGVIAVLSPQCPWTKNVLATTNAVAQHAAGESSETALADYCGYRANIRKAWRVLDGDLSAVSGPKVTAFRNAIVGDLSMVTVDIHATRAARSEQDNLARVFRDDETPGTVEMRAIAEAYRRAAAARGLAPSEAQAVIWTVIRDSGRWVKPNHMGAGQSSRFYARQIRARQRIGLTIHTSANYWGAAVHGRAAALAAVA